MTKKLKSKKPSASSIKRLLNTRKIDKSNQLELLCPDREFQQNEWVRSADEICWYQESTIYSVKYTLKCHKEVTPLQVSQLFRIFIDNMKEMWDNYALNGTDIFMIIWIRYERSKWGYKENNILLEYNLKESRYIIISESR